MPFTNYTELKAVIATRMHRSNLTDEIPDFIRQCEDEMGKLLRVWRQESLETLTTTASVQTVALPARTREVKRVRLEGANARPLLRIPADTLNDMYAVGYTDPTDGYPRHWALQEDDLLLGPLPADAYTLKALCVIETDNLSTTSPTNTILTNYPNLYLQGSLMYGYDHIRHTERQGIAARQFYAGIKAANNESLKRAVSGTPGPKYAFRRRIP